MAVARLCYNWQFCTTSQNHKIKCVNNHLLSCAVTILFSLVSLLSEYLLLPCFFTVTQLLYMFLHMNKLNLEMICSFKLYSLLSLFLLFFDPTIFSGYLFLFNPLCYFFIEYAVMYNTGCLIYYWRQKKNYQYLLTALCLYFSSYIDILFEILFFLN